MIKIGITGQVGFIGIHLYNTLGLFPEKFQRVPFEDNFFTDTKKLKNFVSQCDVIVHLAAVNRHPDPQIIYNTNLLLVKQLIAACEDTGSKPHILFSSSTQEELDNFYGRSKKEGRELLEQWALRKNARFTGMVIPNVFGPFSNPYHNTFVATFCHQLIHGEQPKIEVDQMVRLIFIGELVEELIKKILINGNQEDKSSTDKKISRHFSDHSCQPKIEKYHVLHTAECRVSEVLKLLGVFKENYLQKGILPNLNNTFERNLFITFMSYIDLESFFPFYLKKYSDERGSFCEIIKFFSGGQVSFSTTKPGISRGNHFHTRKVERFAVIKGKARINLRRIGTDKVFTIELDGNHPSFIDMPVWHAHSITNIDDEDLYTIFWINEHFDADDPDTYDEKVK